MSNHWGSNDDFYDSIANKYLFEKDMRRPNANAPERRSASRTHTELLRIIDFIRKESGFNTNAPDSRYQKARELFQELKSKLKFTKKVEENRILLKSASWELFQKYDYMQAVRTLKKMEV